MRNDTTKALWLDCITRDAPDAPPALSPTEDDDTNSALDDSSIASDQDADGEEPPAYGNLFPEPRAVLPSIKRRPIPSSQSDSALQGPRSEASSAPTDHARQDSATTALSFAELEIFELALSFRRRVVPPPLQLDVKTEKRLARPVVVPQIAAIPDFPYARGYSAELKDHGVEAAEFLEFVDNLNVLTFSDSSLRLLGAVKDIEPKGWNKIYLQQVNATFFEPRGLHVALVTASQLEQASLPQQSHPLQQEHPLETSEFRPSSIPTVSYSTPPASLPRRSPLIIPSPHALAPVIFTAAPCSTTTRKLEKLCLAAQTAKVSVLDRKLVKLWTKRCELRCRSAAKLDKHRRDLDKRLTELEADRAEKREEYDRDCSKIVRKDGRSRDAELRKLERDWEKRERDWQKDIEEMKRWYDEEIFNVVRKLEEQGAEARGDGNLMWVVVSGRELGL